MQIEPLLPSPNVPSICIFPSSGTNTTSTTGTPTTPTTSTPTTLATGTPTSGTPIGTLINPITGTLTTSTMRTNTGIPSTTPTTGTPTVFGGGTTLAPTGSSTDYTDPNNCIFWVIGAN